MSRKINFTIVLFALLHSCVSSDKKSESEEDQVSKNTNVESALPSWNDGVTRERIIKFVEQSIDSINPSFVAVEDRIAVFDNDGTLWAEQPYYFQLAYAIDKVKKLKPDHPEWDQDPVLSAAAQGDIKGILREGEKGLIKVIMTTHAGMTEAEFESSVTAWADTAKHPVTGKLYVENIYKPMVELLDYLRLNNYKTYIVSGGGVSFMRAALKEVYGIPAEQIIGSTIKREFVDGKIIRLPEIEFIDDQEGKPINIERIIGKIPIIAFGNSDGDLAMLQYTESGSGNRLMAYIHHTDSLREYAYDRDSHIGKFDKGLDEAISKDWLIVDMESDWKTIYPYD
ncbi:MAG: haloacid dehalogenase-like hydrolase [Flavobacteriales bacterium]|nr:haloacid dehalogenase-like hydrolase [Flavobacteriales bacterium]